MTGARVAILAGRLLRSGCLIVLVLAGTWAAASRAVGQTETTFPPGIVNAGFLETLSVPDTATGDQVRVSFVVADLFRHPVTGVVVDDDYDGTDDTASLAARPVTAQRVPGSSTYSRVTYAFTPPDPVLLCLSFGPFGNIVIRRDDVTLRFRAETADGRRTALVTADVHVVATGDCTLGEDYAYLYDQSQSATSVTPGQSVTFTFRGADPDAGEAFGGYKWRVRRLVDGAITQGPTTVPFLFPLDGRQTTVTVAFPERGRYVVEAEVRSGPEFTEPGRFFPVGAVDVNTSSATSPVVSLSGVPGVVDQGSTFTVTASVADSDANGRVQIIEWDADADPADGPLFDGFERREESAEPVGVSGSKLQQTVDTSTMFGDVILRARVTDNGAMNAADAIRRTATAQAAVHVNRPPVLLDQAVRADEDEPVAIALDAQDPDGDALTFVLQAPPAHGSLDGSLPNVVYTPDSGWNGDDAFTYTASDGRLVRGPARVTVTTNPQNDPPDAIAQTVATDEEEPVTVRLAATDPEGEAVTFVVASRPQHGRLSGDAPDLTYTPRADYFGSDKFTFVASDGHDTSAPGTVTIDVAPVNDPPVASSQDLATDEDAPLEVVLAAEDPDGDDLTFAIASAPAHGSLSGAPPGVTYTPAAEYAGADSFTFTVSDGTATSAAATVRLTVFAVNDPPIALPQTVRADEDTSLAVTLSATDAESDPVTFAVDRAPSHGRLTGTPPNLTYTPDPDFAGADAFAFTAWDGRDTSTAATVSIDVVAAPLVPTSLVADAVAVGPELLPASAGDLGARLTVTSTGAPLAGRLVSFSAGEGPICEAVTGQDGYARCPGPGPGLQAAAAGGYRADFAGDADFAASSANGGVTVS